ncbi:uncharacterized protein LOC116182316 [Photinus pyralis]|uniref:uncharacterized protein LOC116182316 n=1 Tax=Photinus pyralis TaxID=7054 RepID=UPI0012670EC9|nr:uncharacterized protein LOC116182316 [Photinus pyralis]
MGEEFVFKLHSYATPSVTIALPTPYAFLDPSVYTGWYEGYSLRRFSYACRYLPRDSVQHHFMERRWRDYSALLEMFLESDTGRAGNVSKGGTPDSQYKLFVGLVGKAPRQYLMAVLCMLFKVASVDLRADEYTMQP